MRDKTSMRKIATLGGLVAAGIEPVSVRLEMRRNMLRKLAAKERILGSLVGYDDTVIPEIENAILAGHHMVFLGERGQAKSRIMRSLIELLDPLIPAVAGCEINCDPTAPICRRCRKLAEETGEDLPIAWLEPSARYGEKLATPDTSVAELVGEIDPIKLAEGRYLADEEAIHYGLIPRCNRGIFGLNELPDLPEKVQVALFNIMEETDVQIKGFKVRLPLDVVIVASANPEDYTSRGRIITPLKDRFDAEIRTHYPSSLDDEVRIMEQEMRAWERDGRAVVVPEFMKLIIAAVTAEARRSPEVNQLSGVSVRVSISNFESVISNAEKRAARCNEPEIVPRISDLHAIVPSTRGKIEVESLDGEEKEVTLVESFVNAAVKRVFDSHLRPSDLESVVAHFESGWGIEVSDTMPSGDYLEALREIPGLSEAVGRLAPSENLGLVAAATELVLEGLHLHRKLSKEKYGGRYRFEARRGN